MKRIDYAEIVEALKCTWADRGDLVIEWMIGS